MEGKSAIVFGPDWPGSRSGYEIALKSSLQFYLRKYEQVTYLALTDREQPDDLHLFDDHASFVAIPTRKNSIAVRFAKSLISRAPAVCAAFLSSHVVARVNECVRQVVEEPGACDLIFEDFPICSLLTENRLPKGGWDRTFLRSHNVLSEAFRGFTNHANPIKRHAWKHELNKIVKFEKTAMDAVDQTLAITERDQLVYHQRLNASQVGLLPVGFDDRFFKATLIDNTGSDPFKILSLGSMDLRKAHGMVWFLNSCFNHLPQDLNPRMELILGGRGTNEFHDPDHRVTGMGFVPDERKFMEMGQTFINPQKYGSGVKLKSLVAMAYGKCLISTTKGVEGIAAEPNEHFLLADSEDAMKNLVLGIHSGEVDAFGIGKNAREFVLEHYQQANIGIKQ